MIIKKQTLIIFFLLQINFISAQTNLISNGGFETGASGGYPNQNSQFNGDNFPSQPGPDNWESRVKKILTGNNYEYLHSPDWFGPNFQDYDAATSGGAQEGTKYCGMANYELIEQGIPTLTQNNIYVLTMYIQLSNENLSVPLANNAPLSVYLSDRKIKYDIEDELGNCSQGYRNLNTPELIAQFPLNPSMYPVGSGWHKICRIFRANANDFDWFGIQVEGNICDGLAASYVLIDNVKLENICDMPCLPSNVWDPIQYTSTESNWSHNSFANAGVTGPHSYFVQLPDGTTQARSPWHLYLRNIIAAEFIVFDRWGTTEQVHQFAFSTSSLNDPVYGDYLLIWEGDNWLFHTLPQGTYPFILRFWNCNEYHEIIGHSIDLFYNEEAVTPINDYMWEDYDIPQGCCKIQAYIVNKEINGDFEQYSNEFTHVGTLAYNGATLVDNGIAYLPGPVNFKANSNVLLQSENEIVLEDGVNIEEGSNFTAKIDACNSLGNFRISAHPSRVNFSEESLPLFKKSSLEIFPNPTDGFLYCKFTYSQKRDFLLYDQLGTLILCRLNDSDNIVEFNLSNLPNGIYTLKIFTGTELKVVKVIKQ